MNFLDGALVLKMIERLNVRSMASRILFLGILTLGGWGCGKKAGGPPPGFAVPVVLYETRPETVRDDIQVVGTLRALEAIDVQAELSGTIEKISFEEGTQVQAGDILLELDTKKLKAELARAEANFKLSKANLGRSESLFKSKTISREEYDRAVAQFQADRSDVEGATQVLEEAIVEAPFKGVVGSRLVSPGQFIEVGAKITSLVSIDTLRLEMQLPERYIGKLREKLSVELSVAAYPEKLFSAAVYFVAPEVDPDTRTVTVKATVDNPERLLLPGMFAVVTLSMGERKDGVVIPEAALIIQGNQKKVFVVGAAGTIEEREVELGILMPGKVELLKGVALGEAVVVRGTQKVRPGSKVTPSDESDLVHPEKFQQPVASS